MADAHLLLRLHSLNNNAAPQFPLPVSPFPNSPRLIHLRRSTVSDVPAVGYRRLRPSRFKVHGYCCSRYWIKVVGKECWVKYGRCSLNSRVLECIESSRG